MVNEQNTIVSTFIEEQLLNFNRINYFETNKIDPELITGIYSVQVNATNVDISQKAWGTSFLP